MISMLDLFAIAGPDYLLAVLMGGGGGGERGWRERERVP